MATLPPVSEKQRRSCSILVLGKTGVGKSSLVNSIFGLELCKEGSGPDSVTSDLIRKQSAVDDVVVTAWDSPGLSDETNRDDSYLKDLEKLFPELDLLVYCIRMDGRFDRNDREVMEACLRLKEKAMVWDHSVIALTFADQFVSSLSCDSEDEEAEAFQQAVQKWKAKLEDTLKKNGVTNVPIVPTGYFRATRRNPNPRKLHKNCTDWISEFWSVCLNRTKETGKQPLAVVNEHRLRPLPTDGFQDDPRLPLYLQSIYLREGTVVPYGATGHSLLRPYWVFDT